MFPVTEAQRIIDDARLKNWPGPINAREARELAASAPERIAKERAEEYAHKLAMLWLDLSERIKKHAKDGDTTCSWRRDCDYTARDMVSDISEKLESLGYCSLFGHVDGYYVLEISWTKAYRGTIP